MLSGLPRPSTTKHYSSLRSPSHPSHPRVKPGEVNLLVGIIFRHPSAPCSHPLAGQNSEPIPKSSTREIGPPIIARPPLRTHLNVSSVIPVSIKQKPEVNMIPDRTPIAFIDQRSELPLRHSQQFDWRAIVLLPPQRALTASTISHKISP